MKEENARSTVVLEARSAQTLLLVSDPYNFHQNTVVFSESVGNFVRYLNFTHCLLWDGETCSFIYAVLHVKKERRRQAQEGAEFQCCRWTVTTPVATHIRMKYNRFFQR